MKYRLSNTKEASEAMMYLANLIKQEKYVDIKVIKPRRSLPQNAYLHLLLGLFGVNNGMSLDEAKGAYKRLPGNKDIYIKQFEADGVKFEYERSSASLDKDEMAKTIETLKEWSAKMGHTLPDATDVEWLRRAENDIEKAGRYL